MNRFLLFITIFLLSTFSSCKCDKTYQCPSLSDDGLSCLNQNTGDTLKFINADGNSFAFIINLKYIKPGYESKACRHGELGCSCDYSCESNGHLAGNSDSSVNGQSSYYININENSDHSYKTAGFLWYTVFDFYGKSIDLLNTQMAAGDSLLSAIQLGNHSYTNVFVQSVDTTSNLHHNRRMWKAYFTKANGIIGFWDRQSRTLYYRE